MTTASACPFWKGRTLRDKPYNFTGLFSHYEGKWQCFVLTVVSLVLLFALLRSRTKNMMWYGVLGTKELLHRTYKNLEQKVLLEVRSQNVHAWLNLPLRPTSVTSALGLGRFLFTFQRKVNLCLHLLRSLCTWSHHDSSRENFLISVLLTSWLY